VKAVKVMKVMKVVALLMIAVKIKNKTKYIKELKPLGIN